MLVVVVAQQPCEVTTARRGVVGAGREGRKQEASAMASDNTRTHTHTSAEEGMHQLIYDERVREIECACRPSSTWRSAL